MLPTWLRNLWDHNRYLAGASVLALTIGGCELLPQPKTKSPFDDTTVTRDQLETQARVWKIQQETKLQAIETESRIMQEKMGSSYQDLDNKQARLTAVYDTLKGLAGNYGNEVGLPIAGIMTLLGLGLGLDNRRKDAVIEDKKQENRVLLAATTNTTTSAPSTLA